MKTEPFPTDQEIDIHSQVRRLLDGLEPLATAETLGMKRDAYYRKNADPPTRPWSRRDLLAISRLTGKRIVFRGSLENKSNKSALGVDT